MTSISLGLRNAFASVVSGIISSVLINDVLSKISAEGKAIAVFWNMISIIGPIATLEKMEHWSLLYLAGYLIGIFFLGSLMDDWDIQLSLLVGGVILLSKIFKLLKFY